jgi:hypothetical protein
MAPFLITLGIAAIGFILARNFVRRRLRFVDAARSPLAPVVAGLTATLVALPLALLPVVSVSSAVIFGVGVGLGTASGGRALRRVDSSQRRLTP